MEDKYCKNGDTDKEDDKMGHKYYVKENKVAK